MGGARIPEPYHREPFAPRLKILGVFAVLVGLTTTLTLLLVQAGSPKDLPLPSTPPGATVSALLDIKPVAVVVYPIRHGMRMATLDANASAAACLDGSSDLTVLDLFDRTIVFSDKNSLYAVGLDRCGVKPRLLARFNKLAGHRPRDGEGIQCASMSPDGRHVVMSLDDNNRVGAWVASSRILQWRFIKGLSACSWVDRDHVLAQPHGYTMIDPVGIDIHSGTRGFFQYPDVWLGSRSPDGRYSAFLEDHAGKSVIFAADKVAGITRSIVDDPSAMMPMSSTESDWNSDGSRFLVTMDSGTFAYDVLGFTKWDINVTDYHQLGWFSDHEVWAIDPDLELLQIGTGFSTQIVLPGFMKSDDVSDPQVVVAAERPGSLREDRSLLPASLTPRDAVGPLDVHFQRPPSWGVQGCRRCGIEGYTVRWRVSTQAFEGGPAILFASTNDSVHRVVARVLRHSGATRPCNPARMACISFDAEQATLGGRQFTRLDIYGEEGGETVFVARINGTTLLISADPSDPSQDLVLNTLRLASA